MLTWSSSGTGLPLHLHRGVEVSLGLQVVAQVAAAFVQQVVVHRVFLVHRHQLLHFAGPDLRAFGGDDDLASPVPLRRRSPACCSPGGSRDRSAIPAPPGAGSSGSACADASSARVRSAFFTLAPGFSLVICTTWSCAMPVSPSILTAPTRARSPGVTWNTMSICRVSSCGFRS